MPGIVLAIPRDRLWRRGQVLPRVTDEETGVQRGGAPRQGHTAVPGGAARGLGLTAEAALRHTLRRPGHNSPAAKSGW